MFNFTSNSISNSTFNSIFTQISNIIHYTKLYYTTIILIRDRCDVNTHRIYNLLPYLKSSYNNKINKQYS